MGQIPIDPKSPSDLRKAMWEATKRDGTLQAEVDAIQADYVSAVSAFGTDDVLLASNGALRGAKSTAIDKDNVVQATAAYGTDDVLIASDGTGKNTKATTIDKDNVAQASAAFGTDDVLLASDGTGRNVKATAIDKDNVVTAAANFGAADQLIVASGTTKAVQSTAILSANLVTAASTFGTDERIIRSDGVDRGTQVSLVAISDTGLITLVHVDFTIRIGANAGSGAIAGSENIVIGDDAAQNATLGSFVLALGSGAFEAATAVGDGSAAFGVNAGANGDFGTNNVLFGGGAGLNTTATTDNLAIGPSTMRDSTVGAQNLLLGGNAGRDAVCGDNNLGLGASALRNCTGNFTQVVAIGPLSFFLTVIGDGNIGIGYSTGRSLNSASADNNIFVGLNSGAGAGQKVDAVNTIAIGANTDTTADHQIIIGNTSHTAVFIFGGLTVNDAGLDADTRIEGDSLTHMIFLDASASTENIALVAAAAPNWQTMDRGLFVGDSTTAPTGNPSAGVFLYSDSGELFLRNTSGDMSRLSNYIIAGYGAGTNYTLTATAAEVDRGTTDSAVVLARTGVYRLSGRVSVRYAAATFVTEQTITLKLRRTNNTAADVTNSSVGVSTFVLTTLTAGIEITVPDVSYTAANTDDRIALFIDVSALPAAGSVEVSADSIFAERIA